MWFCIIGIFGKKIGGGGGKCPRGGGGGSGKCLSGGIVGGGKLGGIVDWTVNPCCVIGDLNLGVYRLYSMENFLLLKLDIVITFL